MKHYMSKDGFYIGRFMEKPEGGIEVDSRPIDKRQKYLNGEWQPLGDELLHDKLVELDQKLPRWAEDFASQGAFTLYGEAKEVFEEKQKLRASLS